MKTVSVKAFNSEGSLVGPLDLPRVEKSDAEWKAQHQAEATPEQLRRMEESVARNAR